MKIMGILNVTPDSFSDGGKWFDPQQAIARGRELIAQGAQILDIGGESTRPGARAISATEEWERIAPVVTELAPLVEVSVDTYHSQTARNAIAAGAKIINDVSCGRIDPQMFSTVAELKCKYILQHSRGTFDTMNDFAQYPADLNATVIAEMLQRKEVAVAAGIAPEQIILDPGLGFAKVGDHDWQVLRGAKRYLDLGHEVLIGHSRKRFLARLAPAGVPATERDYATAAISGILDSVKGECSGRGVWAVRVHNVAATAQAIAVQHLLSGQDSLQAEVARNTPQGSDCKAKTEHKKAAKI